MKLRVVPEKYSKLFEELKSRLGEGEILKSGGTTVYRISGFTVKITKISKIRKSRVFPYFFGPSKGYREYKNINILRKNGFSTPRPLFYWEIREHGIVVESGFVEEYLENLTPVREVLKYKTEVTEILKMLADVFRKLHDKGFFMRDLTFGNFFIRNNKIVMVDVSRMLYLHQPVPLILRLEDLSKVDSDGDELKLLLDFYWHNEGMASFATKYITFRKKLRRQRKKITHSLRI